MSHKIDLRQQNKPGSDKKNGGKAYKINPSIKLLAPLHPAITDFEHRINRLREIGRKRGKRYSVIGIAAAIAIALSVIYFGYRLSVEIMDLTQKTRDITSDLLIGGEKKANEDVPVLPPGWRACLDNMECAETRDGCCACENGGMQTAVNRNYYVKWENILLRKCADTGCMAMENCRDGSAICEDGICKFVDRKIAEAAGHIDTDNDGLSDDEEAIYGTDPENPDTDGDGYTDGEEVVAGFDPLGEGGSEERSVFSESEDKN